MRDFIPWVRPESSQPPDLEEEKEEEMTGLLDHYATRKRKRQEDATREADIVLDQAVRSSQPAAGGSLKKQEIIISGSPETISNNHLDIGDDILGEAVPAPSALQTILPPAQVGSRPSRSEFTHTELEVEASRPYNNEFLSACSWPGSPEGVGIGTRAGRH